MAKPIPAARLKFKKRTEKLKLGKKLIEALPLPPVESNGKPGRRYVYDAETPRLAICVFSTGAKSWFWVGRINNRPARHKLGEFPEITPEQARKLAAKASSGIANGIDPRAEKRKANDEMTLGDAFERFMVEYAKPKKKSWHADEMLYNRYLVKWKARRYSGITHGDVVSLHNKIGREHGKYAANRMLSLLSAIYIFTRKFMRLNIDNPCMGVVRFKEEERERFLSGDELERFFAALETESELMRDYFMVALLTGARRGNVQAMRWESLELDAGLWRIPGSEFKNGKAQVIHLHADVVGILRRRKETSESEYVFPGRSSGHIEFIYKAWERICKKAELKGVRPHDLRRTLGSWQAATGASLPIIGKTLGHLNPKTTAIYARLNVDPVRDAVNAAIDAMKDASKPSEEAAKEGGAA